MTQDNKSIAGKLTAKTARLPVRKLKVDYERFQPRACKLINSHVAALFTVLKRGSELDPIMVWKGSDGGLWVIEGHHRLAAYKMYLQRTEAKARRVIEDGMIPVEIVKGPIERARLFAAHENGKDRLNLTREEKSQAAWSALCGDDTITVAEVVATGLVQRRTAYTMRKVAKWFAEVNEKLEDHDMNEIPKKWVEARVLYASRTDDAEFKATDEAERREALRVKLRKYISVPIQRAAEKETELVMEVIAEALGEERFMSAFSAWRDSVGDYSFDYDTDDDETPAGF
ncbi:ParB/Srx family N-terminal domain-containing protein [Ruegeria sp. HKCCC1038]|uniref:ParB/Srx family N-terminal domain-containing protein n=1 Tax=Ruegeria sp. HKCCC1038 TaxID=2682982 RepID=UPI001488197F|nr:ParB/Srx family N-terminal domain-containing protein [Ruegeria sp. HKCCC1038]